MTIKSSYSNTPVWRDIHVHAILPEKLQFLDEMAHNYGGSGMEELKVFLKD